VDTVLSGLTLVPVEREVLMAAAVLEDPALRALDALHVATAASLESDLGVLVAYDDPLLAAARSLGFPTDRPGSAGPSR
jgi:predicted nucleic acid-binding protein